MEIFEGHRALFRPLAGAAIAVGNFDGVHLGHQALLAEVIASAGRRQGDAAVYTFEPHPSDVLCPERAQGRLTSPARKQELLAQAGIDVAIVEPFTAAFAETSFQDEGRLPFSTTTTICIAGPKGSNASC